MSASFGSAGHAIGGRGDNEGHATAQPPRGIIEDNQRSWLQPECGFADPYLLTGVKAQPIGSDVTAFDIVIWPHDKQRAYQAQQYNPAHNPDHVDLNARISEGVIAANITGSSPSSANIGKLSGVNALPGCQ